MIKKGMLFLVGVLVLGASGCAPKQMYYWGNYSSTLYHFRKDANEEAQEKHKSELEAVVKGSQERNLRVPPGVYCELGYLLAKNGDKKQALEFFTLEKTTYPESAHFIDRLVESLYSGEKAGKKSAELDLEEIGVREGANS